MKFFCFLCTLFCVTLLTSTLAQTNEGPKRPEEKVYQWLVRQQGPHGILGNQEGEAFGGLYPNALAALCFLQHGEADRAEKIFNFFAQQYSQTCAVQPGGFFQFWDAASGEPHSKTDRWIGDNAWLLIALNHYKLKTGKTDFDPLRQGIAQWLISLQDKDGGIWSGFSTKGPIRSKSTEGNLDSYAALIDYPKERNRVKDFLESKMWLPKEKRFLMGSTSSDPALDCSSWSVAAFGQKYRQALRFAEAMFLQTHTSRMTGNEIKGFADLKGKHRIWLEGTGEMVVAYRAAGENTKAEAFLAELEKAMMPSNGFEGTIGLPCDTNDPPWPGGDERIFVPSQAWYLFGKWSFNPMQTLDRR